MTEHRFMAALSYVVWSWTGATVAMGGCAGREREPDCGRLFYCEETGVCCPDGYVCGTGVTGCPDKGCCSGPVDAGDVTPDHGYEPDWSVGSGVTPPPGGGGSPGPQRGM